MKNYKTLLIEESGKIVFLTLNRPEKLNAINENCLDELIDFFTKANLNENTRVIVIRGSGEKAFTAGADITELSNAGPEFVEPYNRKWLKVFELIESSSKPVIASIKGWSTGGGTELSVCCDFVICAENSKFGLTEINIGVFPGAGAAVRLTRLMGRLAAKKVLMLGDFIDAKTAIEIGLASFVVSNESLNDETYKLASKLSKKAPLAIDAIKKTINYGSENSLELALEYELREFLKLFNSEDQKEGMNAFLQKRKPNFTGK